MVDLLVGKIAAIIENEASLIWGVRGALEELEKELKSMKSFIEDAKETNGLTAVQGEWVTSVMEMCHPVEDIIEEFMNTFPSEESMQIFSSEYFSYQRICGCGAQ